MNRRKFIALTGAAVVVVGGITYLVNEKIQDQNYKDAVAATWRLSTGTIPLGLGQMLELVRYATLAANSHNTQPWLFKISANAITILPDYRRKCPIVDPDNHHLYASLGCATENIVQAGTAFGLKAIVSFDNQEAIHINFEPTTVLKTPLFLAIPNRQCTRAKYDGKLIPTKTLRNIQNTAETNNVSTQIFTAPNDLENFVQYVQAGNTAQMENAAFMKELKHWLRFNKSEAVRYKDGLFSASSGNPTFPSWIADVVFKYGFKTATENDKYREHIQSSSGIIAFVAQENNKQGWINAGRSYQRFALQTTAMGMKHAFINQAVEVPEVQRHLAAYLNIGDKRPDLLLRFGYGPAMPKSLRRSVNQVIV